MVYNAITREEEVLTRGYRGGGSHQENLHSLPSSIVQKQHAALARPTYPAW
jgi:hypothetical protein